jgi:hypothetical protein
MDATSIAMKIQAFDASCDIEQLRNCQRLARERTFISHDAQYNAYEV